MVAGGLWLLARRSGAFRSFLLRSPRFSPGGAVQVAVVLIGLALAWRLPFAWFPVAPFGMWGIAVATDFEILIDAFPGGAPRASQRRVVRAHLAANGILGLATAGIAAAGSVFTVRVGLLAVMLLAVLIVIVLRMLVRPGAV